MRALAGIAIRGRDLRFDRVDEEVHIDLLLCGDGDDRRVLRNRALDKLLNLAVVVDGAVAVDQIDLVLCDDDVLDPDDRAPSSALPSAPADVLGCAHDEHGSVHDRGSREHRCHQRLVARRQRTRPSGSARSLNRPRTPRRRCNTRARRRRDSAGTLRPRTPAGWRYRRVSFPRCCAGRSRAGQRLHERRLPVVDVTDETDVHLRLCVDFSHCWTSNGVVLPKFAPCE